MAWSQQPNIFKHSQQCCVCIHPPSKEGGCHPRLGGLIV